MSAIDLLRMDLDMAHHEIDRLEAALRAFEQFDGDGELWGTLVMQRDELLAALKGVVAVADRKTVEFDAARAAIANVGL
jgi:hypothetical protein